MPWSPGGPVKYKLEVGLDNLVTNDWLFTNCVPHIHLCFPNDRRLCQILGLATLHACYDPTLRETLPETQRIRLADSLQGVDYGVNAVEKVPLHVHSVNGNLFIDEMMQQGQVAGGQAAPVVNAPGLAGAANGAILQSILLNQQQCVNQQALQQVQMEMGFSNMKQHMDQWFVILNDNLCGFGGTTHRGFARQDPVQAAN